MVTNARATRRALLGIALATAGAKALSPRAAGAADNSTLKLGSANNTNNTASTTTRLTGGFAGRTFEVRNLGPDGARNAVFGYVGMLAPSATIPYSIGVLGTTQGFLGSAGVQGTATGTASAGVVGQGKGANGVGVLATGDAFGTVALKAIGGVTAHAAIEAEAEGIAATAVHAVASAGGGVALDAVADEGLAVRATSLNGIGLVVAGTSQFEGGAEFDKDVTVAGKLAAGSVSGDGAALTNLSAGALATGAVAFSRLPPTVANKAAPLNRFAGKVKARSFGGPGQAAPAFNSAGTTIIKKGASEVRVTTKQAPAPSKVLALLQDDPGADVFLRYVRRGKGFFDVVLSGQAARRVRVDYFIVRKA